MPTGGESAKMARKLTFAGLADGGQEKAKCFYTGKLSHFHRCNGHPGTLFACSYPRCESTAKGIRLWLIR